MSVPAGLVRVYANANVPGLAFGRWHDVSEADPRLADWLDAGLVSKTGPRGEAPPDVLPRARCCGGA